MFGDAADLVTPALLLGCPEDAVIERLQAAFTLRLIVRIDREIRFLHDRIHQVAYELTPAEQRPEAHLAAARALLDGLPPDRIEAQLFEIVRQISRGALRITSPEERARAAELNLRAGRKAQAATHHAAAIGFFLLGAELLAGARGGAARAELAFELDFALAQCRFPRPASSRPRSAPAPRCASAPPGGARPRPCTPCSPRSRSRKARWTPPSRAASQASATAGSPCRATRRPPRWTPPSQRSWDASRAAPSPSLALPDLPPMTDLRARAVCDLAAMLYQPAYHASWEVMAAAASVAVELSLTHGNTCSSAAAYATFGLVLAEAARAPRGRVRLRRGGLSARPARGALALQAQGELHVHRLARLPEDAFRPVLELMQRELDAAISAGNYPFACYFGHQLVALRLFVGDSLDDVADEASRRLAFAERTSGWLDQEVFRVQLRLFARLRDPSAPDRPADCSVEELAQRSPIRASMATSSSCRRACSSAIRAGPSKRRNARAHCCTPRAASSGPPGFTSTRRSRALPATLARPRPPASRPCAHLAHLTALAEVSPANFAHQAALVSAELARLSGDELAAERAVRAGPRGRPRRRLPPGRGLASELCARFYEQRGLDTAASAYLARARDSYEAWGARAKVCALLQRHPELARRPASGCGDVKYLDMLGILEGLPGDLERAGPAPAARAAPARGHGARGRAARLPAPLVAGGPRPGGGERRRRARLRPRRPRRGAVAGAPVALHSRRPRLQVHRDRRRGCAAPVRDGSLFRRCAAPSALGPRRRPSCARTRRWACSTWRTTWSRAPSPRRSWASSMSSRRRRPSRSRTRGSTASSSWRTRSAGARRRPCTTAARPAGHPRQHAGRRVRQGPGRAVPAHQPPLRGRRAREPRAHPRQDRPRAVPDRDRRRGARQRSRRAAGGQPHREGRVRFGARRHARVPLPQVPAAPSGRDVVCGVRISTDVTERKRAEEMLRHSHALLEATLDSTADGILVVDDAGRPVRHNRRFREMWGIPEQVLLSQDDRLALCLDQLTDSEQFLQETKTAKTAKTAKQRRQQRQRGASTILARRAASTP